MDWSTFWTAIAAIGQVSAAGITVWAVVVALRQGKIGREQFLRARYDDARPILIVVSDSQSIKTQQGKDALLDWNDQHQIVKIQNVGKGIALHVRSVIYGPESVIIQSSYPQQPASDTSARDTHWYYWKSDVVRPNEEKELDHHRGASTFETKNKHIQQNPLNAPAQPFWNPQQQEPTCICRISVTYHDVFHRKHASIFDLVLNSGWQEVDTLEDIPQDLRDLEQH
jgi:hypothetical protein